MGSQYTQVGWLVVRTLQVSESLYSMRSLILTLEPVQRSEDGCHVKKCRSFTVFRNFYVQDSSGSAGGDLFET